MSYKAKLEDMGYIIKEEIQYWSLEHPSHSIYRTGSGDIEEICKFWWQECVEEFEKMSA